MNKCAVDDIVFHCDSALHTPRLTCGKQFFQCGGLENVAFLAHPFFRDAIQGLSQCVSCRGSIASKDLVHEATGKREAWRCCGWCCRTRCL